MEFVAKKKPSLRSRPGYRARTKIEATDADSLYPSTLSFYLEPPTDSISLQEFEDYAVARLKLLRTIERINLTSVVKYSPQWMDDIKSEVKKLKIIQFCDLLGIGDITNHAPKEKHERIIAARKFDHLSHYIFRLAYCRTDELKKWLILMEVDFFRFKYMFIGYDANERAFIEKYHQFEKLERKDLDDNIRKALIEASFAASKSEDVYLVPFTSVLELVRTRKVYLSNGMAYVPFSELGVILATMFRKTLSQSIARTGKLLPEIMEDERLNILLTSFEKRYTGKNYSSTKKENEDIITVEDLNQLAKTSLPLCMKNLHEVVEKEHHLKHWGRLQLGLFFKGVGLSLEEAIKYWRFNFTQKTGMDGARFDKQYLYNIRHMYGKEGKRADYTPYSCMKIITSSIGPGDHHGCPFRHFDAMPLRSKLAAANIPNDGIQEIMKLVDGQHYSIACQKYFEWTHNKATVEGGIQHPNQYFDESRKANLGLLSQKAINRVKGTRVNVYSQSQSSQSQSQVEPMESQDMTAESNMEDDQDDFMASLNESGLPME